MKRGLKETFVFSFVFLINFVSAQFYSGYSRFSPTQLIDRINPADLTLLVLFFVFFAVLHGLVFINFFRGSVALSSIVSGAISLITVYYMYRNGLFYQEYAIQILIFVVPFIVISAILIKWAKLNKWLSALIAAAISGILTYGLDVSGFNIISTTSIYPIASALIIIGFLFALWKIGFAWTSIVVGVSMILISGFTDIFYSGGLVGGVGIILTLIGFGLVLKKKKKLNSSEYSYKKPFFSRKPSNNYSYSNYSSPKKSWRQKRKERKRLRKEREKFEEQKIKEARKRGELEAYRMKSSEEAKIRQRKQQEEYQRKEDERRQQEFEARQRDRERQQDAQRQQQREREKQQSTQAQQQKQERKEQRNNQKEIDRLRKAHDKLYKEFQKGLSNAQKLHGESTRLGWTKSGRANPRQGESERDYKHRVKKANETYKAWYRQYSKNIQMEKDLQNMQNKIKQLQS